VRVVSGSRYRIGKLSAQANFKFASVAPGVVVVGREIVLIARRDDENDSTRKPAEILRYARPSFEKQRIQELGDRERRARWGGRGWDGTLSHRQRRALFRSCLAVLAAPLSAHTASTALLIPGRWKCSGTLERL